MSKEQRLQAEISELRAKLDTQTVQMGYALECIRQLVHLPTTDVYQATQVRTAKRFLEEMEVKV